MFAPRAERPCSRRRTCVVTAARSAPSQDQRQPGPGQIPERASSQTSWISSVLLLSSCGLPVRLHYPTLWSTRRLDLLQPSFPHLEHDDAALVKTDAFRLTRVFEDLRDR